jgi:hypothetical protein
MLHAYSVRLTLLLALAGLVAAEEVSGVAGTWRGESVCAPQPSGCHNETVTYYIKDIPHRSDVVVIQADKIVDGKPITMGTGEWQYDRGRQTLEWRMPQRVWLLNVNGNSIEGTLKLADGTVVRKMTLKKD